MCIKSRNRMECVHHGYPYHEAEFEDNSCDAIASVLGLSLKPAIPCSDEYANGYKSAMETVMRALAIQGIKDI